jgi:hypothetical protein
MAKKNENKPDNTNPNTGSSGSVFNDTNLNEIENQTKENLLNKANKKIKKENEQPVKKQVSVYYLYFADDTEYFSFDTPEIYNHSVIIKKAIKKGVVQEKLITGEVISVEFNESLNSEVVEKSILGSESTGGVMIKCVDYNELYWLDKTEEQALQDVKSLKIQKLETMLPNMMKKMEQIQEQNQMYQQQIQERQQRGQARRGGRLQDDELEDF